MKHKKIWILGLVLLVLAGLAVAGYNIYRYPATMRNLTDHSLSGAQAEEQKKEILSKPDKKILVAYFSYSGTTKSVADAISLKTGAELFEIAVQEEYSNVYTESNREIRKNERPALTDTVSDMEEYDIVMVGYPVWWHATPAPVNTFLESYDLKGKLIIPFCTSGESGIEETLPTFLDSCEGLAVYGAKRIHDVSQLDGWLSELGLTDTASDRRIAGSSDTASDRQIAGSPGAASGRQMYEYEIQELSAQRDDKRIYGVVYIPQEAGAQMPAVIYAHGYGVTHQNGIQYAEKLAEQGYVVYCFDFCGGSASSQSDGSPLEMSILTEQSDLEAVIQMVRELDYVDSGNLFLLGASQGGLVAGITAAANKEALRGLILLYPGFEIVETVQSQFSGPGEIPDSYHFLWMTVGRRYIEDVWDYQVYDVIGAFDKDVLLIHGDADSIVPISSSERTVEAYPSAELKVLAGAGHGLHGKDAETAVEYMLEYLQAHCQQSGNMRD